MNPLAWTRDFFGRNGVVLSLMLLAAVTFWVVFLIGSALAGFAGAVALPAYSAEAGMGISILIPTLAVVVIGGLGSLKGALFGSLLIGTTLTFGLILIPGFASILMYALLVLVLLFKPSGLFPARR